MRPKNRATGRKTKQASHSRVERKRTDREPTLTEFDDSNSCLSNALRLPFSAKPDATWADIFDWQRMEDEIEDAALGKGEQGNAAVYLIYQKMGTTPLRSHLTYASDFFVPMNLRPEEKLKYVMNRKKREKKEKERKEAQRKARAKAGPGEKTTRLDHAWR